MIKMTGRRAAFSGVVYALLRFAFLNELIARPHGKRDKTRYDPPAMATENKMKFPENERNPVRVYMDCYPRGNARNGDDMADGEIRIQLIRSVFFDQVKRYFPCGSSGYQMYVHYISLFFRYIGSGRDLLYISEEELGIILEKIRLSSSKTGWCRMLVVLSCFFDFCVEQKFRQDNPMKSVIEKDTSMQAALSAATLEKTP